MPSKNVSFEYLLPVVFLNTIFAKFKCSLHLLVRSNYFSFKPRGESSTITLFGRLVHLSACQSKNTKKFQNDLNKGILWGWKQMMSARLNRPLISSLDIFTLSVCLSVHINYWPHIPGAYCISFLFYL